MEGDQVKKSRRKYDADFKQEVLKMVESGRSVSDISKSLGISGQLIYQWKRRSKIDHQAGEKKNKLVFDEEKVRLQKRVKELEQERDILKKALGIFSRMT